MSKIRCGREFWGCGLWVWVRLFLGPRSPKGGSQKHDFVYILQPILAQGESKGTRKSTTIKNAKKQTNIRKHIMF